MNHKRVAKEIASSDDPGGELVKLLEDVAEQLNEADKFGVGSGKAGVLITQAIPEGDTGNPVVCMYVFTNTVTDFPVIGKEEYIKWVEGYLEYLKVDDDEASN